MARSSREQRRRASSRNVPAHERVRLRALIGRQSPRLAKCRRASEADAAALAYAVAQQLLQRLVEDLRQPDASPLELTFNDWPLGVFVGLFPAAGSVCGKPPVGVLGGPVRAVGPLNGRRVEVVYKTIGTPG